MWKEKIKHGKENEKKKREKKRKMHTEGGKKERTLNLSFIIGDEREILKLIFNTINYLMKHNNLSC